MSLFAAVCLAVVAAMAPAWAGTTLVVGGIMQKTVPDIIMENLLAQRFAGDTLRDIEWPAEAKPYIGKQYTLGQSIGIGTDNLYSQILSSTQPITVVGLSAGSLVVDETMRRLLEDGASAPSKANLTFVIVADSSRQKFINDVKYNPRFDYTYKPAPVTKYDVIVVTGEYDGFADFPDRVWNMLAVINAYAGVITEHVPTAFADLDKVPLKNITEEVNALGGKTIHYLVPATTLPIVKLLPFLKRSEASLKASIDKAYKRNDPQPVVKANVSPADVVATAVGTEDTEDVRDEVETTGEKAADEAESPRVNEADDNADATTSRSREVTDEPDDTDVADSVDDDESTVSEESEETSNDEDSTSTESADSDDTSSSDSEGAPTREPSTSDAESEV
ncbi:PE-PPE domain-containing protein [Mycolicibacterium psychrotolerans]|uniref:PE-PPE domain-containing protein n=1 Tax=Mycolicibacterium psychrotolerans TaxID=216929 RepID=A0A7I7MCY0_9MYCO|nr:PE-PPE domain-containing protein [Mycolicibacterium psychrotolerans]BBX70171.1 hypothetical protein MPSYJ_36320 [Mycolicibacterium psychrotolerans]